MTHKIVDALVPLAAPISEPQLLEGNPRVGDVEAVAKSLNRFGQRKPIVAHSKTKQVIAGNHTLQAARRLGWTEIAVVWTDDDDATAKAFALADNRTAELGTYDEDALAEMIADVLEADEALLEDASFSMEDLDALLGETSAPAELEESDEGEEESENPLKDLKRPEAGPSRPATLLLSDRYLAPPFTVLNAREGWWQERKNTWIELGLEGELGRDDKPRTWYLAAPQHHHNPDKPFVAHGSAEQRQQADAEDESLLYGDGATSIFDPVLCELMYRWFSPPKGLVLDPCAGGSVRGIVAAKLGRRYIGIDIRENQIEADIQQGRDLLTPDGGIVPDTPGDNMPEVTPVEHLADKGVWLKREDKYVYAGVRGAKVRTCMHFIAEAREKGVGVVTAGSRMSPQVNFVAQIAYQMGVKCRVHVPSGPLTPELLAARAAGAKITQHDYGYNSVIIARAREDAAERGWIEVPYGMESQEAVDYTKPQVVNIPDGVQRIVNACGSGMTLAGILWGLKEQGIDIPVTAICVGHVPEERLDRWAPEGWRDMVELVDEPSDYHQAATEVEYGGVLLDAYYEAKCIPYLREGDLLWVSAIRPSAVPAPVHEPEWIVGDGRDTADLVDEQADMIFTCPPYGDLEVYSDDPRDLSTMEYAEFIEAFGDLMSSACKRLADDRFAVVVVGDFRDKKGYYYGFPADTVKIMEAAGLRLYNEAILVTHAASLPLRAGRQFDATRKMGKTHQNCLVFIKGDPKKATRACGPVVSSDASEGPGE